MSAWRKVALTAWGWDKPVPCRACGQKIEVRSLAVMVWTAPFILFCVLAAVAMRFQWLGYGAALWLGAGVALLGVVGVLFGVPLARRGRTDPQAVSRARAGLSS
ncbi:MAG: hypothetical protein Q4G71_12510 [Pseudomonadota bacterium]|nr:hypothetical protein [Pseudomonadota bacterium]